ncbi:hypothetical protein [Paenibacillus terrae]|uniref:Uncharacterized protein n=1 Tax=Paenibacillus terrae TaxID=159743 RepID=A0A0D7X4X0_9BACL|nr:hypothetical protein [Paenibacillus terrae]KJD46465.1 hypothetical protein QD47_06675 [Paenibacillus terrae]
MTVQEKLEKQDVINRNLDIIDEFLFDDAQDDELRRKAIKALIEENMQLIDLSFGSVPKMANVI